LLVCTLTAGWMKAFSSDPRIGFYALANKNSEGDSAGPVLAPAKSIAEMERVAFNNYICGTLTVLFVVLVLVMAYFTLRMSLKAFRNAMPSAAETPPTIREGGLAGATAYCSKTGSVVPRSHWGDGRGVLCVRAERGDAAAPGLA